MKGSSWFDFWQHEQTAFFEVMRMATLESCARMEQQQLIAPGNRVLDFGCGPGFMLGYFAGRGIDIYGVDINPLFVSTTQASHPGVPVGLLNKGDNAAVAVQAQFGSVHFDRIVLLSVIQYFSKEELRSVLVSLSRLLSTGGQIILSDVITRETSAFRDAWALTMLCARQQKIMGFFRFMTHLLLSNYRRTTAENRLLAVSEEDVHEIASSCGLSVKRIDGLTIHPSRTNYVLGHL